MIGAVLGVGIRGALVAALAAFGSAPGYVSPGAGQGTASGISITMTTVNDGRAVSLLDPGHPVWAHLAATGAAVDVTVTFTDRGHPLAESAEGGDSSPSHTHATRGADVSTPDTSDDHPAPKPAPARKATESSSQGTDAPHGVSILPPSAIKRPSYRWQSLVPGTIK